MYKIKKVNTDFVFLFCLLSIYFISTFFFSYIKPLSFDELFTFNLSKLTFSEIMSSLGPLDPHPPLNKFITSISQTLFGTSKFTTRFPSIIFFGITLLITYKISSKLINKRAAKISTIVLLTTTSQLYSYEARPYGLVFMLTSILIYLLIQSKNKNYIYVLITIITAAIISSHFYAFFIPFILIFGYSLDLLFFKKKINWKLWLSVLIGCSIILIYIPAIQKISNSDLSTNNWASPSLSNFTNSIRSIYQPFILLLIPSVLNLNFHYNEVKKFAKDNFPVFSSLFFLSSLSIVGFLISLFFGAYNTRYFLASILGCLFISTLIISQYNKKQFVLFSILFLLLFGFQINNQVKRSFKDNQELNSLISLYNIKKTNKTLMLTSSFNFMKIQHYAKEGDKENIEYILNLGDKESCKGCSAGDISILNLSKINKKFKTTDLHKIKKTNDTIYFIFSKNPDSKILKSLLEIRKFDTIGKTRNHYLIESTQ